MSTEIVQKRPKTGGRQKGSQNKLTKEVKNALWEAFEGLGGVDSLIDWGRDNPTPFYSLWGKLAPIEANVKQEVSGELIVNIVRHGDN